MSLLTITPQASQTVQDSQQGFAGGLNTVSDQANLLPTQARQLVNSRLTEYGAVSKRGGTQKISAATANGSNTVTGMTWWHTLSKFVAVAGTNLYTLGPNIPVTWTSVAAAAGNMGSFPSMKPFYGSSGVEYLYIASGVGGGLQKLANDLTTFTNGISSTPVVTGLEVYNQRLWGWNYGSALGNNSLYYSDLAFATSSIGGDSLGVAASNGGVIRVLTFGTSGIVACRTIGASLLIFHIKGVSRLTGFGQSDISVDPQPVSTDFALVSSYALATNAGIAWGVGFRGLYQITEGGAIPVHTPERPDPIPAAMAATSNPGLTFVAYETLRNEVWVSVYGIGVYIYNTILGAWSGPFSGSSSPWNTASAMFSFPGAGVSGWRPAYLIATDSSGWAYKCDVSTYKDGIASDGTGGSAYTQTIQCHRMFAGSPVLAKTWRRADVLATLTSGATAPSVAYTTVFGSGSTATFRSPTATTEQVYYNAAGGAGPYVDVTITDTGTAASQYANVTVTGEVVGIR